MSDYIISLDPGNGGVNGAMPKQKGGYKSIYFPSVRAAATGDSLGLGKELELDYSYADWYGHRYVYGDDVLRVTRRSMERHSGPNRYGNELHQFLIAVAVAQLGVKKGAIDLTLFAPPGMYNDVKATMIKRIGQGKPVEIQLKGDKSPRKWEYENITVWPEGIGAAAVFILDDQGKPHRSDVLNGENVLFDFGAYTADALRMSNGNFNPEELQHATFENAGVWAHVIEPVLRIVRKHGSDFEMLSADDIDRVLRLGIVSDDYTLVVAGKEIDLKEVFHKHCQRYAEWVANNIIDNQYSGLRGIKNAILVGGGALLVESHLRDWYGDKILNRKLQPTAAQVHPTDYNAVGGLRLALARQGVR
jgi:hypothetical protein